MSIEFTSDHIDKTIQWFEVVYKYGDFTEKIVELLASYFPRIRFFNAALPQLKKLARRGLEEKDREILEATDRMRYVLNKSPEDKQMMI